PPAPRSKLSRPSPVTGFELEGKPALMSVPGAGVPAGWYVVVVVDVPGVTTTLPFPLGTTTLPGGASLGPGACARAVEVHSIAAAPKPMVVPSFLMGNLLLGPVTGARSLILTHGALDLEFLALTPQNRARIALFGRCSSRR